MKVATLKDVPDSLLEEDTPEAEVEELSTVEEKDKLMYQMEKWKRELSQMKDIAPLSEMEIELLEERKRQLNECQEKVILSVLSNSKATCAQREFQQARWIHRRISA